MYTLILMTSLSAGPESLEFNGFFRRLFNQDDSDVDYNGCYGAGSRRSTGCAGCSGSCVGSCQGEREGFFSRMRAFTSDTLGCYGSGRRQSAGCSGTAARSGCQGSRVAVGSCHGSSCFGSMGPSIDYYAGCFGGGVPMPYGTPLPSIPAAPPPNFDNLPNYNIPAPPPPGFDTAPATPRPAGPPPVIEESRSGTTGRSTSAPSNRAKVLVKLPEDARLYADGRELKLSSSEREFVTPPLPSQQGFAYNFRIEYERDGETISQARRVEVAAGHTVTVEFVDLAVARQEPKSESPNQSTPTVRPVSFTPPPLFDQDNTSRKIPAGLPLSQRDDSEAEPAPSVSDSAFAKYSNKARITVKLPAGTRLYVDGKKFVENETRKEFATPVLPPDRDFEYVMKAERTVNGQSEYQLQKVVFRAGELLTVDFSDWPER